MTLQQSPFSYRDGRWSVFLIIKKKSQREIRLSRRNLEPSRQHDWAVNLFGNRTWCLPIKDAHSHSPSRKLWGPHLITFISRAQLGVVGRWEPLAVPGHLALTGLHLSGIMANNLWDFHPASSVSSSLHSGPGKQTSQMIMQISLQDRLWII